MGGFLAAFQIAPGCKGAIQRTGFRQAGVVALILVSLATNACLRYRGAPEILIANSLVMEQKQPEMESGEIIASESIPLEMQHVYSLMVEQQDYIGMTSIVLQLLAISDRVCHDYVSDFLDLRDGINFGTEVSKQLSSVFSAFGVSGTTIGRYNAITGGIGVGLNNYYLTNALVDSKLKEIIGKRRIYKQFIINAWQSNTQKTQDEIRTNPYSILMLLLDVERFHQLCGFYDVLVLNPPSTNINDDLKELFAYSYQPKPAAKKEEAQGVAKTLNIIN